MIVSEKHKAVLMALRDPGRVTAVIPKARVLQEQPGKTLLAVPHTLDVYRVLKNIGIEIPHPMLHYYDWPCFYDAPMAHQLTTSAFLATYQRAYCLNGMGSSKTLSALWSFDYLRSVKRARRLLVVAPLSTLERTWGDEVFRNFHGLRCLVLHGTRQRRLKLLAQDADVYVINHDGIKVILDELVARGFDVLVLDELTQIARNPRSGRWKAAKALVDSVKWTWGLTGTPIPNDPCDAYGQIKLLTPTNAPRSFTQFQDLVSRQVGPFKRLPLPNATATVFGMMQPAIRFATRDCIDLPPTMYVERSVELSPAQLKAYKRMEREKVFQLNATDKKTIAVNEAVVAMKLIQIACGSVYTGADDDPARIESPERIEVVKEVIDGAEGKVIVFCPLIGALDYITEELRKTLGHDAVAQVDGRVSANTRNQVFSDFQQGRLLRVIVAQPSAMSHGVTLTAASVITWYAPCYSNETYEQANARIVRPGQKRNTLIVNIEGTALERRIYGRLKDRQKIQGQLLEMVEAT